METRANYALIGLFTLLVIAGGFLFVYWFSVSQGAGARDTYRVAFYGSVSGLGVGSQVLFNGLRVGEVRSVRLSPSDPKQVIATIAVDRMTPVNVDTKARLEVQILSGVASIALIGGRPDAPRLGPNPDEPPMIIAEPSEFQDILESAREIANNLGVALQKVSNLVDKNQDSISETIRNVERFTAALGDSSPDVSTSLKNLAELTAKLDRAADEVEGVLKAAHNFLESPDGRGAVQSISEAARSIKTLADNLDKRTAEITVGITRFTGAGLQQVEALASDGRRTLNDINRTLRSVDRNPQQFIFGSKPSIPEYSGRR